MEKFDMPDDGAIAPQKHRGLREPWKPGESGNPAGRPKGSRNKLSEEFVAEFSRLVRAWGRGDPNRP